MLLLYQQVCGILHHSDNVCGELKIKLFVVGWCTSKIEITVCQNKTNLFR